MARGEGDPELCSLFGRANLGAPPLFQERFLLVRRCHQLYMMLRTFQPRRLIEIGSGFSSAATLDATEENNIEITFIDLNPEHSIPFRISGKVGRAREPVL